MAIVYAGSKPKIISINQSNLNSKNIPVYNTNYPQDVRAQYNLIRVFNSKNYTWMTVFVTLGYIYKFWYFYLCKFSEIFIPIER